MPMRRHLSLALGAVLLACAVGLAPAAAGADTLVRVGLAVGQDAPESAAFTPAAGAGLQVQADGSVWTTERPVFVSLDSVFLELGRYPDVSSAMAALAPGLAQQAEILPVGSSVWLVAGPFPSEAAAQAAAQAAGLARVTEVGPYGALLPVPDGTVASALALCQTLAAAGILALPLARPGGLAVLAGDLPDPAGIPALLAKLAALEPQAAAFEPTSPLALVTDGESLGLVADPAALTLQGTGTPPLVGFQGALYRGVFSLAAAGGGLDVVDTLPLEAYVAGVVPEEMPASWPLAALEAQAVACRTYALYELSHASSRPYDLTSGLSDQTYRGFSAETPATDQAVAATAGEVLLFRGQPIQALFFADSGGATENSENVFVAAVPYLRGVREPPGYVPHTWTRVFSAAALTQRLDRLAPGFGTLLAVLPAGAHRTFSGRLLSLTYVGSGGTVQAEKDGIRALLDLPSTWFSVQTDAQATLQGQTSARQVQAVGGLAVLGSGGLGVLPRRSEVSVLGAGQERTLPTTPQRYTFIGRGEGHGVGLSQWGAYDLAQRGWSWQQIVTYYYTGVSIGQLP